MHVSCNVLLSRGEWRHLVNTRDNQHARAGNVFNRIVK